MSFLNTSKVTYSIQALLLFLDISREAQSISLEEVEVIRKQCVDLMEDLATEKVDALQGALALNNLIDQMNQSLSAPYPSLPTDTFENFVRGEIVAFEHYLNQELRANHLTVFDETALFNQSLMLWEQVGTKLSPGQGASELAALVEKLNSLLPEKEHYPFPK